DGPPDRGDVQRGREAAATKESKREEEDEARVGGMQRWDRRHRVWIEGVIHGRQVKAVGQEVDRAIEHPAHSTEVPVLGREPRRGRREGKKGEPCGVREKGEARDKIGELPPVAKPEQ